MLNNLGRNKIIYLACSILVIILIIFIIFFMKNKDNKVNEPTKSSVIENVKDYKDVIVKSIIQRDNVYKLVVRTEVGKTGNVDVFVLENDVEIGKSEYSSVPVEATILDFSRNVTLESKETESIESLESESLDNIENNEITETIESTENITESESESMTESTTESTIESTTESIDAPIDAIESSEPKVEETVSFSNTYIGFEDIASKAIEEGVLYETDLDTNVQFVQTLLSEGYVLDTQISTSNYNDLYLTSSDNNMRIVIALNKPLMILSEMEDINVDVNSILKNHQEGDN